MYLVTGGAGFIGSNIVFALEKWKKAEIIISDSLGNSDKWRNISKRNIQDIVRPDNLFDLLKGNTLNIEAIIHMGAISSTIEKDVDKIINNNFRFSRDLWNWASKNEVPFIFASSAATYGAGEQGFIDDFSSRALKKLKPLNPYAWSKHLFDSWVCANIEADKPSPPQWVGLKFFNVYGPNEYHKDSMMSVVAQIYPSAKSNSPCKLFQSHDLSYEDGGQLRDFVYVDDCSNAIVWFLKNNKISGLFNFGSGKARSFKELANAVYEALDKETKITYIPTPSHIRDKYQYFTEANMDRLKKAGWDQAPTTLEDGVRNYVLNFLENDDPYR